MLQRIFLTIKLYSQRHRRYSIWIVVVVPLLLYIINAVRNTQPDPFDQPFCNPSDGVCHEKPYVASPRTVYSAWNKEQYDQWWKYHEILNQRVAEYAARRTIHHANPHEEQQKTRPLILLGDSITESWLGTGLGIPKHRAEGVPEVLKSELSASQGFDPLVLAISGDQTQHLLWRLQHGQLLSEYSNDPTAMFVVLIGTNNLGAGELPGPTARGILAVVEYLLKNTSKESCLLIFEVLPRGDGKTWLQDLCPPRCQMSGLPYTSFLPPIQKTNQAVREGLEKLRKTYKASESRLKLMDCGMEFLDSANPDQEVMESLMPDLLHPNEEGHQILAKCIQQFKDHK
ncbi:exo-1,4-beta-glucosidase [Nitzschia inconspicua]|uniref:Exo-1,4-beta-glucosidase n=1 Tax=Nitzschia inconspicua TaxID=303405 RepID=A0A9K3KVA5_9STRA|nr:exo-1,4-beta-glucosidase [Nitzschia inconspicua]